MRFEHWRFTLPLRLKSIFLRGRVERELAQELRFHLENKIDEGVAQGLTREQARIRALRSMGGLEQRIEEIRDTRRVNWLTDFLADWSYALRCLRRTPGLTAFVVITLALGIGMTATPFSMVDALILRPYPVANPHEIVTLTSTTRDDRFESFSYREFLDIQARTQSYDGVIASTAARSVGYSAREGDTPKIQGGVLVSANFFSVLGVEPALGRGFRADEDQVPGRDAVVVLGPHFWQREFARDPGVIGREIRLNGRDFTIIGVAPESFPGLQIFTRPDLYVPLAMAQVFSVDPQKRFFEDRGARELSVRGRLKPDVSLAQARHEMAVVAKTFGRDFPALYRERGATVHTYFEMRTRGDDVNWKFSVVFTILALAVLLVACTNVAGLLLSRAQTRTREVAVRLALGAGRSRLIRLLLTESLVLTLLGGLGGIAVGYLGIEFLRNFQIPSEVPVTIPFRLDGRVLIASLATAVLCALFCGLAPALQSTRMDLANGIKSADVELPRAKRRLWGRNALVVAQVATSLMLLAAAFLMARDFQNSSLAGTGFDKERLLLARFDPRLVQYDAAQTQRFYQLLTERARETPGIEHAGLTQNPPLSLADFENLDFVPEEFDMPADREHLTAAMDVVDPGFFETLGIPVLSGRGFTTQDTASTPRVAIVNEQFVQRYWPEKPIDAAVGKRFWIDRRGGTAVEIVGVAKTVTYRSASEDPTDFVYFPLAQNPKARLILFVRTSGDPLQAADSIKSLVRTIDANLPLVEMRTYEDLYRYHVVEGPGIAIRLVATMGVVGVLLAIAGLYGLVAYNVSRRTREIGIRMAIGAAPANVLRLVISKGLTLVGIGTLLGVVMGFGVERMMNSMLFNAGGVDFVVYLIVVPSMLLVTALAAYIPARRASRISPTLALRTE